MLKLHDYVLSADCYAVRLLLGLTRATHEIVAVDVYPGGGKAPVLEDGDVVLDDLGAILTHIADRHDPTHTWLRQDGRGLIAAWLAFAMDELRVLERARQVATFGAAGDITLLRRQGWEALRVLEDRIIERTIDGSDWIVRRAPSLADVACFPYVALSHDCGLGLEEFPGLSLWMRRVRKLPGFVTMPGIPDFY